MKFRAQLAFKKYCFAYRIFFGAALLVVLSLTVHRIAHAQWSSIDCVAKLGQGLPVDYGHRICKAEDLARQGKFVASMSEYEKLVEQPFHEVPNFEALIDLARTQCIAGRVQRGVKTLDEFALAFSVYEGKRSCDSVLKLKTSVGISVHKRMCGELLKSTYADSKSKDLIQAIFTLRARASTVSNLCFRLQSK